MAGRWLATYTVGARTVPSTGPERRFSEDGRTVRHRVWVRTLAEPFRLADFDSEWLLAALRANASGVPDILAFAFQYVAGSRRRWKDGRQIAGDARYGPVIGPTREEGADFNDYLGIVGTYPDEPADPPEVRQIRALDCSGYVRMVYGCRPDLETAAVCHSVPLCRTPRKDRAALSRRAHEMATAGPGVMVIPIGPRCPADVGALAPGDLVFFDSDASGSRLDHVGIYLGLDTRGRRRFISSRKRANGPTMGDRGGRSILDGAGLYARSFRAARRL
jgi:hypothetical protein